MCSFANEYKIPGNGRHCCKKVGAVLVALFWQGKAKEKGIRSRFWIVIAFAYGILWRATNAS